MAWKCPDCGAENPESKPECACGYAYYKVMGIKPGESRESVGRTYKYLIGVWQENKFAHDPLALKNAAERKKKINDAYEIFKKHFATGPEAGKKETGRLRIISFAALAVLVVAGLIVYISASQKSAPVSQAQRDSETTSSSGINQANQQNKSEGSGSSRGEGAVQAPASDQRSGLSEILPGNPEEKAIALVRKSHAVDRVMDVDTVLKKWAEDNSAKFQVVGWKATKMEEQIYLVTFTISDGVSSKGFYFDVDLNTGAIRHLAGYPELQKKYNLQYKQ